MQASSTTEWFENISLRVLFDVMLRYSQNQTSKRAKKVESMKKYQKIEKKTEREKIPIWKEDEEE